MDPFSVSTACMGLLAAVAQLSIQIRSFVSGVREARHDMDAVSRELTSLSLCLETLRDDSHRIKYPAGLQQNLIAVLKNCDLVAKDMLALLKKMSAGGLGSRMQWNTNGRNDMNKLRSSLEAHKSALDIALDMTTLMITSAVKEDTEQIRTGTNEIKADTSQIPEIKQDTSSLIRELGLLRLQVTELQLHDSRGGILLRRFLEESTSYAESVVDIQEFDESRTEMPPEPDPGRNALSDLSRPPRWLIVESDDEEVIGDAQAAAQSQNVRIVNGFHRAYCESTETFSTDGNGKRPEQQEPEITAGLTSPNLGARPKRPSWTKPASTDAEAAANTQVLGGVKDTVRTPTVNHPRKVPKFSLNRHGIDPNALAEAAATSEPVTHALRLPIPATRSRSVRGHVTSDNQAQSNRAADDAQSRNPYRQVKSVESNDQASPFVPQTKPTNPYRQGKSVESKDQTLPSMALRTRESVSNISSRAAPKPNSNTIQSSSPGQPSPSTVVESPSKVPPRPTKFPDQNAIREATEARHRLTQKEKISMDKRLEILIRGKKSLSDRLTGMHWFAKPEGSFAEIKQVLSEGASMRFRNFPTNKDALTRELQHSCRFEVLELLLSFGANVNDHPNLVRAIKLGRGNSVLQLLLEYGADPSLPKQLVLGRSPLYQAVRYRQSDSVKLLLDHKADVNFINHGESYRTALNLACFRSRDDIVKTLLEHGADPNLTPQVIWYKAVSWGSFQLVMLLLGSIPVSGFFFLLDVLSYGSALNLACGRGHADIVETLLEHGADPNLRAGFPPTNPTQVTIKDWGSWRPRDIKRKAILRLLKEHGAKDPKVDEYLQR